MKGRTLFITAIIVTSAGIALLFNHNTVRSSGVTVAGGILFIISGLISALGLMRIQGRSGGPRRPAISTAFGWISISAALVLGLCMLIFQERFVELIATMFAIIIGLGALFQFFLLAFGTRPVRLPGWLFAVPILLVGGAVYIFLLSPETEDRHIMLVTGICLTFLGIATIIESMMVGTANRTIARLAKTDSVKEPQETGETIETGKPAELKSIDEADGK